MRLLIVDDDYQIREGMRNGIEWDELGITEIDTCANGVEAMDLFHEKNPEIIVADIQMPGMNGLDMVREIRAVNEKTRVIFISAYSEFEYCRQALVMGASDYVLKPIQMKEFMEVLRKNIDEIQQEFSRKRQYDQVMLDRLVRELYVTQKEGTEGEELCKFLCDSHPLFAGNYFITTVIKRDYPAGKGGLETEKIRKGIVLEDSDIVWFPLENVLIGISEGSNSALLSIYQQNNLARAIYSWNQSCGMDGCTVSAAISESHGKKGFRKGFSQAMNALEYSFYKGASSVILCPAEPLKDTIPVSILKYAQENEKRNSEQDSDKDISYLKKLEVKLTQENMSKEGFKKFFLEACGRIYNKYGFIDDMEQLRRKIDGCCFAGDCLDIIIKDFEARIKEQQGLPGQKENACSHTVKMALNYMHKHFCSAITVEQVAGAVGKSTNYFSSMFKKEVGCSFTEYITALRLERAKWLLLHTNKQIQEICEEVGYSDYIYFSQLFRQRFGYSASKMRKMEEK